MSDIILETILKNQPVYRVAIKTKGKKELYEFTRDSNKYHVALDKSRFDYTVTDHENSQLFRTDSFTRLINFLKIPLQ